MSAIFAAGRARSARSACASGRPRSRGFFRLAAGASLAATVFVAGCGSSRDSIRYNRWAPTNGRPSVLNRAEWLHDAPERALNKLDERIENVVY